MSTNGTTNSRNRVERTARLKWVPIALMRVSPLAQRELNSNRVNKIAASFDPELIGALTVNERAGHYYLIDGQHRAEALREMGWGDQQVQCWTYTGLTEEEEAERFLTLNDQLTVDAFSKFRVGVQAGRAEECEINRVVQSAGLRVSREKGDGAISAVGTLRRVLNRTDSKTLGRTLRIIRDAYGDAGLEAAVIDGVGMVCGRYNGELDDENAVTRLSAAAGGVGGLLNRAYVIKKNSGQPRAHCVAAAVVDTINGGKGGKKLPSWWRDAS